MNRQLKFRAWYSKMSMWVYFDLNAGFGSDKGLEVYKELVLNGDKFYQFTGLLDKNGNPIFEGDILRILYTDWASKTEDDPRTIEQYMNDKATVGYVGWDEYSTGWVVMVKSNYSVKDNGTVMSSIVHGVHGFRQVIGNIYENPELIS